MFGPLIFFYHYFIVFFNTIMRYFNPSSVLLLKIKILFHVLQSWSCDLFSCRNITICWRFLRMESRKNEQNKIKASWREHQTFISCDVQSYSGCRLSPLPYTSTHMEHSVHMEIKLQATQQGPFKRDSAFSQSRGREEEGGFRGAWVKSLQ